jgi:serine/threonine protein kinase
VLGSGLDQIPGYQLIQQIGAGAFGVVWEAKGRDGEPVALKLLDCRTLSRSQIADEVRVLRALSELRHPHIIRLLSIQPSAHRLVLVMEKADGNLHDLRQVYRQETGKNIPLDHALELLEQAAEALDFLAGLKLPALPSSRGLQHCDIKPSNLLLLGECLKVADFGLCAGTSWQTHTRAGWRGTPPYAAPELYHGKPAVGTDQFALAVTFCNLVMGERPFWKHARPQDAPAGMPIDLTKLREHEVSVIARALHPQPSLRWSSCRAFIDALRQANVYPRLLSTLKRRGSSGMVRKIKV